MHKLGLDHLNKIKQTNNLIDIWQKKNADKRLFTLHNNNQQIHSRIDSIYIKNNQIINTSIILNGLSDHDAVTLTIDTGYWKLNTFILKQKTF